MIYIYLKYDIFQILVQYLYLFQDPLLVQYCNKKSYLEKI